MQREEVSISFFSKACSTVHVLLGRFLKLLGGRSEGTYNPGVSEIAQPIKLRQLWNERWS